MTPAQIITALDLRPHPEGGHYRETWRHDNGEARGAGRVSKRLDAQSNRLLTRDVMLLA